MKYDQDTSYKKHLAYLNSLPGFKEGTDLEAEKLLVGLLDISESCEEISKEIVPKILDNKITDIDEIEDLLEDFRSHIEHILWHVNYSEYLSSCLFLYRTEYQEEDETT